MFFRTTISHATPSSNLRKRSNTHIHKNTQPLSSAINTPIQTTQNAWLLHSNICGIKNKIDELQLHIDASEDKIEILCLTEHFLSADLSGFLQRFDGFNTVSFYGRPEENRGGACILVRDSIVASNRPDIGNLSVSYVFECAAAEIGPSSKRTLVITLYRTPDSDANIFLDHLEGLLSLIADEAKRKNVLICGDINIDMMQETVKKENLICLLNLFGFESHITIPTRITKQSETSIDCLLTNYDVEEEKDIKIWNLGLSDHTAQKIRLNMKTKSMKVNVQKKTRIFSNKAKRKFKASLKEIDWIETLGQVFNTDVNTIFDRFLSVILNSFENAFPKKIVKKTSHKQKPWMTKGLKTSIFKKREMSERAKFSTDPDFIIYYKRYRMILKRLIRV